MLVSRFPLVLGQPLTMGIRSVTLVKRYMISGLRHVCQNHVTMTWSGTLNKGPNENPRIPQHEQNLGKPRNIMWEPGT